MSDHSKPRRWTLCEHKLDHGIEGVGVSLAADEAVPVREDCITEADVEAVVRELARGLPPDFSPVQDGPLYTQARAICAHIFEGGEQS